MPGYYDTYNQPSQPAPMGTAAPGGGAMRRSNWTDQFNPALAFRGKDLSTIPFIGGLFPQQGEVNAMQNARQEQARSRQTAQDRIGALGAYNAAHPVGEIGQAIEQSVYGAGATTMVANTEEQRRSLALSYAARSLAGRSGAASAGQAGAVGKLGGDLGALRAGATLEGLKGAERAQVFRDQQMQDALRSYYTQANMSPIGLGQNVGAPRTDPLDFFYKMYSSFAQGGAGDQGLKGLMGKAPVV